MFSNQTRCASPVWASKRPGQSGTLLRKPSKILSTNRNPCARFSHSILSNCSILEKQDRKKKEFLITFMPALSSDEKNVNMMIAKANNKRARSENINIELLDVIFKMKNKLNFFCSRSRRERIGNPVSRRNSAMLSRAKPFSIIFLRENMRRAVDVSHFDAIIIISGFSAFSLSLLGLRHIHHFYSAIKFIFSWLFDQIFYGPRS